PRHRASDHRGAEEVSLRIDRDASVGLAPVGLAREVVENVMGPSRPRGGQPEDGAAAEIPALDGGPVEVAGRVEDKIGGGVLAVFVALEAVGNPRRGRPCRRGYHRHDRKHGHAYDRRAPEPSSFHSLHPRRAGCAGDTCFFLNLGPATLALGPGIAGKELARLRTTVQASPPPAARIAAPAGRRRAPARPWC